MTILPRGPSPNSRPRRGPGKVTAIVIHDTASRDAESAIRWMINSASNVSAHYVVGRDGAVYNLVAEELCAWHAGVSTLHGVGDVNEYSVGIEVVDADDHVADPYPPAQLAALETLTADISRRHQVPLNRIVGHADVAIPYRRKIDPGPDFEWSGFLLHVAAQLLGADTHAEG